MNIRCPFCDELLMVSDQEVDLAIECPRCRKTFVWREILRERERAAEEERWQRELALQNRKQTQRQRIELAHQRAQVKREAKERRGQEKEQSLRAIQWYCHKCDKGLCQLDFDGGRAFYDDHTNKAYCRDHVPAWLYAREEGQTEFRERLRYQRRQAFVGLNRSKSVKVKGILTGRQQAIAAIVIIGLIFGFFIYASHEGQKMLDEEVRPRRRSSFTDSPEQTTAGGNYKHIFVYVPPQDVRRRDYLQSIVSSYRQRYSHLKGMAIYFFDSQDALPVSLPMDDYQISHWIAKYSYNRSTGCDELKFVNR